MITVELPAELENKLISRAEALHTSKSRLIQQALELLFEHQDAEKDSYELGKPYFGRYGSGTSSLSATYRQRLKDKLRAQNILIDTGPSRNP